MKKGRTGYVTLGTIPLEEFLAQIGTGDKHYFGVTVNSGGTRLRTFLKGTICVMCGLKATHWAVQKNGGDWHVNLRAIHPESGKDILFTRDHIVPRAKGGLETLENQQPMCDPCNVKKGVHDWTGLTLEELDKLRRKEQSEQSKRRQEKTKRKQEANKKANQHKKMFYKEDSPEIHSRKVDLAKACAVARYEINREHINEFMDIVEEIVLPKLKGV